MNPMAPLPRQQGRPTRRQIRRIYASHAVFWVSVVGLVGSLIGYLTGTRFLIVPILIFGVVGVAAFVTFLATLAPLALGRRPKRRPYGRRTPR